MSGVGWANVVSNGKTVALGRGKGWGGFGEQRKSAKFGWLLHTGLHLAPMCLIWNFLTSHSYYDFLLLFNLWLYGRNLHRMKQSRAKLYKQEQPNWARHLTPSNKGAGQLGDNTMSPVSRETWRVLWPRVCLYSWESLVGTEQNGQSLAWFLGTLP